MFRVIDKLEVLGLKLGYPHSSALEGSEGAFRELRPKRGDSPLRIIYAYDPKRDAVLIIGGDKSGDPAFYERILRRSEAIWAAYLAEQSEGKHE